MIQTLGDGNSPFIGRHGAADSSIFSPASPWEWVTLKNLREVRQWWHKMLGIILRVPTKNPSKGKRSRQSWAPVCSSMPLQHPDLKWLKGLHCHPWWSSELLLADARGGKTKGGGGRWTRGLALIFCFLLFQELYVLTCCWLQRDWKL